MEEIMTENEVSEVAEPTPEPEAVTESTEDIPEEPTSETETIDDDIRELREEFPELSEIESITELTNPIRYAALRDLGLSPAEAYILTSRRKQIYDNRSHLTASVPVSAKSPGTGMSARELKEARELFGNISDAEIYKLYKKVTK